MAFRALRRTVAEIDERHHDAGADTGDQLGEDLAATDRAASRRGFLTRAMAGGALAVGATALPVSGLVPGASAQTDDADEEEAEQQGDGSTTSTTEAEAAGNVGDVEPGLVEGTDLVIVVFLQSIELTAVEAYEAMVATGKLPPATAQTARQFALHHHEHAEALAELAGGAATTEPNPRLSSELLPGINAATLGSELITAAYNLEESITATYAAALGQFNSWQAAAEASKILPVDGQHAVVWSQVLFPDPNEWFAQIERWIPNFQSASGAINITEYAAS